MKEVSDECEKEEVETDDEKAKKKKLKGDDEIRKHFSKSGQLTRKLFGIE